MPYTIKSSAKNELNISYVLNPPNSNERAYFMNDTF
jgi:hypothetical protein